MYEGLVKSLQWLSFMFPETHPAQDDADRMSNNIHLYCTQAANAIEELQKQRDEWESHAALAESFARGWIPVTERLPEDLARVIVFCNDGVFFGFCEHLIVDDKEVVEWNDFLHYPIRPTHWMPIPESPKEEN